MGRSGDEPMQARSPLRLRLSLAVFGLVVAAAGVALWSAEGRTVLALLFAVAGVIALVDAAVVVRRIRQGPHFQPGRDVPPYRPVDGPPREPSPRRRPPSGRARQRTYLVLMAICLGLIALAWLWVRLVSTTAAVVLSLVAMVIPPVAVILANTGWDADPSGPSTTHDARDDAPDDATDDGRASPEHRDTEPR